ncbi:hypothetical protein ACRS3X_03585 [Ectopseudomonas hydrolytica]|uniref:hypothetical protein n=1 Tax=Ectopseudomonas hydrolytica TaxID=2493633 RepID=UPI003EE292BC
MKYFVESRLFVNYFFVLDEDRPVLPFGICGPFAKKREAKKAVSKLRSTTPGRNLGVYRGGLAKPCRVDALVGARAKARAELKMLKAILLRLASGGQHLQLTGE